MKTNALFKKAVDMLEASEYTIAFTGAGISAESGIPTFRDTGGLWNQYDPQVLQIDYFRAHPDRSWPMIRRSFYSYMQGVQPNEAHKALTAFQLLGFLQEIITQNIDTLHQRASSEKVIEFHGTLGTLTCMSCGAKYKFEDTNLKQEVPRCTQCDDVLNVLKPDFVFFGEDIPRDAYNASMKAVEKAKLCIVIGTSGVVVPAAQIPEMVKDNGGKVLEINLIPSAYRFTVTDHFIQGKATEVCRQILNELQRRVSL